MLKKKTMLMICDILTPVLENRGLPHRTNVKSLLITGCKVID